MSAEARPISTTALYPKPMYAIGRHICMCIMYRLVQNIPGALGTKYMHRKMVMTTPPAAPDTKFKFLNVRGAAPFNRQQRVCAPKYKTIPRHGTGGERGEGQCVGFTERLSCYFCLLIGTPCIRDIFRICKSQYTQRFKIITNILNVLIVGQQSLFLINMVACGLGWLWGGSVEGVKDLQKDKRSEGRGRR